MMADWWNANPDASILAGPPSRNAVWKFSTSSPVEQATEAIELNNVGASPADAHADESVAVIPFGKMKPATVKMTAVQWMYIFLVDGLGAMVIGGLINFAVACGKSSISFLLFPLPLPLILPHQPPPIKHPLTHLPQHTVVYAARLPPYGPPPLNPPPFLFSLPISLVADTAITTILQCLLTWFCMLLFANSDLRHGRVAPLTLPNTKFLAKAPTSRVARWFLYLDHYPHEFSIAVVKTPANPDDGKKKTRVCCGLIPVTVSNNLPWFFSKMTFLLANLGRSMLVAVASYAVLIGPAIGIMIAVGTPFQGDWVYLGRWDAAIFKAVYGAVLALLISPAIAFMWMVRAGWILKAKGLAE